MKAIKVRTVAAATRKRPARRVRPAEAIAIIRGGLIVRVVKSLSNASLSYLFELYIVISLFPDTVFREATHMYVEDP